MFISQIWYTKKDSTTNVNEELVMQENNCLDPDYVEYIKPFDNSELHNWNNPVIKEVFLGSMSDPNCPDLKKYKSYELSIYTFSKENGAIVQFCNKDKILDEHDFTKEDLEKYPLTKWISMLVTDYFTPFNELDEELKEVSDYDIDYEITKNIKKYNEDSYSWSNKEALFNAGCLAKKKLCKSAVFFDADDYEVTNCPKDLDDYKFFYIELHW